MIWKRKETFILELLRFSFSCFDTKLAAFSKTLNLKDLCFCFFKNFNGAFLFFSSGSAMVDPFSSADSFNSIKSHYVTKPDLVKDCCGCFLTMDFPAVLFFYNVMNLYPSGLMWKVFPESKEINLFIVKKLFMRHRRQLIFSIMHDLTGTFSIKGWSSLRSDKKEENIPSTKLYKFWWK